MILRGLMHAMLSIVEESAANLGSLSPDVAARAAFLELRNKVQAFRTFEHVDEIVGMPLSSPIGDLVACAMALDAPVSVWAAEAIGYHVTTAGGCVSELRGANLPLAVRIPLHAGMGSALAAMILDGVNDPFSTDTLDDAVVRFEDACTRCASPTCVDVSREALGFIVRSMYAGLLPMMATRLRTARPELQGLFWHGAGRAVYFAPCYAFPLAGAPERALEETATTMSMRDRRNLVAGIAWAATLVNLSDPEALEPWIAAIKTPDDVEAFAFGVHSALVVWRQCAPCDPALAAFAYRSRRRSSGRFWDRIREPTGLNGRAPGELFEWQPVGRGASG